MDSQFTPLPSLEGFELSLSKRVDLEPIRPLFFVPKLDNRPQDPITDTINLGNAAPTRPSASGRPTNGVPTTIANGFETQAKGAPKQEQEQEEKPLSMWLRAARKEGHGPAQNLIKSWDALRPTYPSTATPGGLLSEQDASVFSAVQEFVAPTVRPEGLEPLHISPTDLLAHLMSTLVGNSSPLYSWDSKDEQMVLSNKYHNHVVIASGLTEVMSNSVIHRFIKIGTLLRRLDHVVESFRSARSSSTHHAFAHSLAVVLDHTRKFLTRPQYVIYSFLFQVWLYYTDTEELLSALGQLCSVDMLKTPPYDPLPSTAALLLSHIYGHLSLHVDLSSPQPIRATIAFIFSTTSDFFLHSIDRSVGIGKPQLPSTTKKARLALDENNYFEEGLEDENLFEYEEDEWPDFFPPKLSERLPKAKKSLKVLFAAAPEHPLLTANIARRHCKWVWDEEGLERVHKGERDGAFGAEVNLRPSTPQPDPPSPQPDAILYQPELADLRIFDLEPGAHFKPSLEPQPTREMQRSKNTSYQSFLCTFPSTLPPITPTLAQLTEAVLSPLGLQCSRLSSALLELFLSPPFSLANHFVLLRDYLLLDSASFTSRLRSALFSEIDAYQPIGHGARARTRARLGIKEPRDIQFEQEDLEKMRQATEGGENEDEVPKWGVGLGLGLSERGVWPPGGAELGFALRRVIVDSLAVERDERNAESDDECDGREGFTMRREAEWRLGFAIRDLPVGEGREEWLNPSSIEALDFLYLDYKPPHPLEVLFTPQILSKYHRIFNFLLRLLRVETVSRGLFHSIHQTTLDEGLFQSAPQARRLLLRFRFQTHSFVSALTSYIFDSAIGTHFNAFMRRLGSVVQQISSYSRQEREDDEGSPSVPDVFELMNDHSKVLDKILGACMLRTQQRAIAEIVTGILSNILDLGTLIGDMKRGIVDDSTGEARVKKLYHAFERKMFTFIKVLKALDDKGEIRSLLSSISTSTSDKDYALLANRMGAGRKEGADLSDLLLRLDLGGWWTHEAVRRAEAKRARMRATTLADDV